MSASSSMVAFSGLRSSVPSGFDSGSLAFSLAGLFECLPWEVHPLKRMYYMSTAYPLTISITGALVDVTGATRVDLLGLQMNPQAPYENGVYYDPVTSQMVRVGQPSSTAHVRTLDPSPPGIAVMTDLSGAKLLAEYNGKLDHAALLDKLRDLLVGGVQAASRFGTKTNPGFVPSIGTEQSLRPE